MGESTSPVARQLELARTHVLEQVAAHGVGSQPCIGFVLGSGLSGFADLFERSVRLPYVAIPGMLPSSVAGHAGFLSLGSLEGLNVACLAGRTHLYEGHAIEHVVFGCWLLARLGCRAVLLTNAAGAVSSALVPGDLMLIEDHLNLTGRNPLVGFACPPGPRFVDMTDAYDPALRNVAATAAERAGREFREPFELKRGVYAGLLGPNYETPAEIRMLRALGADAVGMSTVNEVLALRHVGVRVGALSCITNYGAGLTEHKLSHDEVQETAARIRKRFESFLKHWALAAAAVL